MTAVHRGQDDGPIAPHARLGRRASDVGVHRFTAVMLAENRAVVALVRAAGGVLTDSAGSTVTSSIPVVGVPYRDHLGHRPTSRGR